MKVNFFKYIFIIFVIAIAIYAVYLLYFNKTQEIQEENSDEFSKNIEVINDLRLAISNFDSINPLLSNNKEVLNIDKVIFEPLISISKDYKLEMILAKECSKISDKEYVIKVDNDKKWQDGTNVTSKDVSFTINTLKQNDNSVYSYNVKKVLNIEIIDSETLKIILSEPEDFFEYNLTFPIMSSQYYLNEDFYNSKKIPIGTGMYKISEISSSNIKLIKNENWWNREDKTKIDTINIKLCSEIGEVYNSFKMKNTDIFTTYNTNLEDYIGTIGYYKQEVKSRQFNYLAFNVDNKILKNKEVRQAINYSIDRKNIISSVFNNNVFETKFPLDYGSYLYNEENLNSNYNSELARKVLAENGWEYKNSNWQKKDGYSYLKINLKLTVNQDDSEKLRVAENIQNQLGQAGIKVSLNKVSNSKYNEILINKNYEMILTGVYNSFSPNLDFYFGQKNIQNYNNEEIIKILNEVKNIQDEKLLKEKYSRIEQIYNEDIPFVSLYRNKLYIVKNQNVVGELEGNNYFSYYKINKLYRIN